MRVADATVALAGPRLRARAWVVPAGILLVAFLVRGLFLVAWRPGDAVTNDAADYDLLAMMLLERGEFAVRPGQPLANLQPGYPLFLAGVYALFGHRLWAARGAQALVGAFTALLALLLGRRLFGERAGVLAAIGVALSPELVAASSLLLTEVWFAFLLGVAVWTFLVAEERGRPAAFLAAGLAAGLAALTRGTALVLLPLMAGSILLRWPRPRAFLLAGLFVAASLLPLAPWIARNYIRFGAFIPVRTAGGHVAWSGNYLPWDGEWRGHEPPLSDLVAGRTEVEADRILYREAWAMIAAEPGAHLLLWVRKIPRFWLGVPGSELLLAGRPGVIAFLGGSWAVVLALGLGGAMGAARRDGRGVRLVLLALAGFTLLHLPLVAIPRFRVPLIPLVMPLAAAGLLWAADGLRRRRGR